MDIAKPKAATTDKTKAAPSELVNTYEHSLQILLDHGLNQSGEDAQGIFLHLDGDKRNNTVRLYYDSGRAHIFSKELDPLEQDENYTTIDLIHALIGVNFMDWAYDKELIEKTEIEAYRKASELLKDIPLMTDAQDSLDAIKDSRDQQKIFDNWLFENSVTLLFGTTGIGKTAFAMEIGTAVATGKGFGPFVNEQPPREVLYYNFEMTTDDMKTRRMDSLTREYYPFPKGFKMANKEVLLAIDSDTVEIIDYMVALIQRDLANASNVGLVVIDNITWLENNLTDSRDAIKLVKKIVNLMMGTNAALMIMAHTPKNRRNRLMAMEDMQGSQNLVNISQYQVAIRESESEPDIILFKNFKQRFSRKKYFDTLPSFKRFTETETAPLQIVDTGDQVKETDHIQGHHDVSSAKAEKDIVKATKIDILVRLNDDHTQDQIAEILGVSRRTINNWKSAPDKPKRAQ